MTEEELTRMAMLKAEAVANERKAQSKEVIEDVPKAEAVAKVEDITIESTTKDEPEFQYEIVLGKDKKIKYKNWTGKTKKQFKKLFSDAGNIDDINFDEVINLLIKQNIDTPEIYLSDIEQQYIVLRIRETSLTENFNFETDCPNCGNIQEINSILSEAVHFTPGTYPVINEDLGIEFVDIKTEKEFKDQVKAFMDSDDYDGITTDTDIEIAMHIKKDDMSVSDKLNWMDELTLKDLLEVNGQLSEVSPQLELSTTRTCLECNKDVEFKTSMIPNMFDDLLQ